MDTIVLSHALYQPGMDALEGQANIIVTNNGNGKEILKQLKLADAFILRIGKIDRNVIEACPNLKVIARPGVGVDSVDVRAATEHGIPVVICPAVNFHAVAEHTIALIFALSKNLLESDSETRKGNFGVRSRYSAIELSGRTLTILGFGHIGREVARLASAVGMKICIFDPFVTKEAADGLQYIFASDLEQAISSGDFVSVHMPSLSSTRGMFGEKQFRAMKKSAYFINCARGDIVNEAEMVRALTEHVIAGAGIDVLKDEPMKADHPLMKLPNVIITPHMAAQTQETTKKTVLMAAEGTLSILRGEKWKNVCNPEVYEHPRWRKEGQIW
ncbi:phosphoglycerate dehydrogenase [Clostridium sp. W14A]|nr:phosphoglycerate dehydrogenase [Clostridium sp. W14A]